MSNLAEFDLTKVVAGKSVGFASVRGEVTAVERWTETRVSSAAGVVRVHGDQFSVSPPRVWATATRRKAIWLKTEAGEFEIPVPEDVQVRQGHRVVAVIATGVDNRASQWAAVVNRDTSQWTQIDRFPPCGSYDAWTAVVMGFGQGVGNTAMGIICLYAAIVGGIFLLVGQSGMSFITGVFIGIGIGFVHSLVGIFQSKAATTAYGAAVKAACDHVAAG